MNRTVSSIVAALAMLTSQGLAQDSQSQKSAEETAAATKYDKLEKAKLQEELKRLQKEILIAEHAAKQATDQSTEAANAYKIATDNRKPELLLEMLDAEARSRKPVENCKRIRADFEAAKRAYIKLILGE